MTGIISSLGFMTRAPNQFPPINTVLLRSARVSIGQGKHPACTELHGTRRLTGEGPAHQAPPGRGPAPLLLPQRERRAIRQENTAI